MERAGRLPARRRLAFGLAVALSLSGCGRPGLGPAAAPAGTTATAATANGGGVPLLPPLPFTDVPDGFWAARLS